MPRLPILPYLGFGWEMRASLTREYITTTGRSRLAFNISVEFHKPLSDPISGEQQTATTWQEVILGQGGDVDTILSAVSRLTDTFIDEYLRVNEQARKQQD